MRILFVGDIVGARASARVAERLPSLRAELNVDLAIINAENCAPSGLGMASKQVDQLFEAGADVITGGNHSWDTPESIELLARDRVIRPNNIGSGIPGHGITHVAVGPQEVTVINLADACSMKSVKIIKGTLYSAYKSWRESHKKGVIIVDYHGDHVLEKQIFTHAVDGEAAAVIGTHTHEPTSALHILPKGTAFVSDAGMVGPAGGVQGFDPTCLVAGLKANGDPFSGPMPSVGVGPVIGDGILLEISGSRTVSIRRVSVAADSEEP
jgi:2',3'-cyclic-nucleotide 2'-phosphodiesterase